MSKLVAVEFVEAYTPYTKGEIAGFEPEVAKELIEKKVANAYKTKKEDKEKEEDDKKEPETKKGSKK
jgi:pyruvate/2-oxoacid:ferredoxin oxidoreductase beta subunit